MQHRVFAVVGAGLCGFGFMPDIDIANGVMTLRCSRNVLSVVLVLAVFAVEWALVMITTP